MVLRGIRAFNRLRMTAALGKGVSLSQHLVNMLTYHLGFRTGEDFV